MVDKSDKYIQVGMVLFFIGFFFGGLIAFTVVTKPKKHEPLFPWHAPQGVEIKREDFKSFVESIVEETKNDKR